MLGRSYPGFWLFLLAVSALAQGAQASAVDTGPQRVLEAPGRGTVRALVIGIDRYQHVVPLRGAVSDARDIESALKEMGASDVTTIIDAAATRSAVLEALASLVARARSGDLVLISLAGHGAKEDERVKGSSPDKSDEVFLLSGFDTKPGTGTAEKILNHEFHHFVHEIEVKNAEVLFVADTCYGGGLAREIPVGSSVSYRQVPRYRLVEDDLKPVSTAAESFLTPLDFERTTFLAAVDSETKAPEIMINGAYRGALSYAVARAIEGAADEKKDGKVTLRELFSYARRVVYQLSDERQNIVTMQSPSRNIDSDLVLELGTRSVSAAPVTPTVAPVSKPPALAVRPAKPLRLASVTGRAEVFSGLKPLVASFEIVDADASPDVLYDSVAKQAIVGNDTVAYDVAVSDLSGILDRTAAVQALKTLVVKAPQTVSVMPDASLHREGEKVEVEVDEAKGRNLLLADIAGDGTVQLLYPREAGAAPLPSTSHRLTFRVQAPFGADQILAITSNQSLEPLTTAIKGLDARRAAGRLPEVVARLCPTDSRVGLVGLFTVP